MNLGKKFILKNQIWNLCILLLGLILVIARWIYKTKIGVDGKPTKFKAYLVSYRFQQIKRIDFNKLFASIAK